MKLYDQHVHTHFSHDSGADPRAVCEAAIKNGLSGVAFTDHADIAVKYKERRIFESVGDSIRMAKSLAEEFKGRLEVFSGFEIGEGFWYPERQKEFEDNYADIVDAVLCSVHLVQRPEKNLIISIAPIDTYTKGELDAMVSAYFEDILTMLDSLDGDILCHLSYPLRYITLKHGIEYDLSVYKEYISTILKRIIQKDMALEVNTSNFSQFEKPFLMPEKDVLDEYFTLGGRLVTIGSDAHAPDAVGAAFDTALEMLRAVGFTEYHHFQNRVPIAERLV